MLQENNLRLQAACQPPVQPDYPAPDAQSLINQLCAAGCGPIADVCQQGQTGCGVSLELSVRVSLRSQAGLDDAARMIREHLLAEIPLTITLYDLALPDPGDQNQSAQALETLCSRLHYAGVPRSQKLGVCLGSAELPLRAFSLITRCWLGDGPRFALLGAAEMRRFDTEIWHYLWRFRASRWEVMPAYAETVATPCPLLADEAASALLPTLGLQAPAGTAWLPLQLHLPRFANPQGIINLDALKQALFTAVTTGEQLLDLLHWPTAELHQDAKNNRRIAINITGFGDLVRLQNKTPSDFCVLESLLQLAQQIRSTVWDVSAKIARQSELLPAIAKHEPSIGAADEYHCRSWATRWQAAIERSAVRHRNLLVMSPYSVLPADDEGCAAYADLLPVIGFADAHNFATAPPLRNWNIKEFCHFHRRARAVMQQQNGVSLIATRA